MTYVSCLLLGLALAIAIALLTLAGVLIGWFGPAWLAQLRRRARAGPPPDDSSGKNGTNGPSRLTPPRTGG